MRVDRKLEFGGQQSCRQLSSWEKENSEERQGITTQLKNTASRITEGQESASYLTPKSRITDIFEILQNSRSSSFSRWTKFFRWAGEGSGTFDIV